ncbi:MAG: hypothetical protein ACOZF0_17615 [Thermodesulfobacteriota bacterium]
MAETMAVEMRDDSYGHFRDVIHTGSPCRTGDESALDTGDREAFVTDGIRNRSYKIENIKIDHKKQKPHPHDTQRGMGNSPGFPIPPPETGPSRPETAFEKEKAALLARYTPTQQHTIEQWIDCMKRAPGSGQITEDFILTELKRWSAVAPEPVIKAIRIYTFKRYYLKKSEKFLWSMIRCFSLAAAKEQIRDTEQPAGAFGATATDPGATNLPEQSQYSSEKNPETVSCDDSCERGTQQ